MDVADFGTIISPAEHFAEFHSGIFECCNGVDAPGLALFSFVCCPVRMAVNGSATGFMSFWSIVIIGVFFLPLIPIVGYILRLHIRQCFGMNPHPVADFFAWLFCYCCSLTQESKLINREFDRLTREVRVHMSHVV